MKAEHLKNSKTSWKKMMVRKWLNKKNDADEFHSHYLINDRNDERKSCSDKDSYVVVPEDFSVERWLMEEGDVIERRRLDQKAPAPKDNLTLRMFVGTWNVGGKSPNRGLNLKEWLKSVPADIYVLGFQEIVPLNAGNVLGTQDNGPAAKWLSLIRQALNTHKKDHEHAYHWNSNIDKQPYIKPRVSFSDLLSLHRDHDELQQEENSERGSSFSYEVYSSSFNSDSSGEEDQERRYCLAAHKQMVGIFLCVWVRADLYKYVSHLKVSCVRRGVMGYLRNKGSISISMRLHETTFCFVCTHLASGEKEGDEIKRNSDVLEILRKTRFSHSSEVPGQPIPPGNILGHEKIIWLGDLNYRLASDYRNTHELLKKNDWQALLGKDQLLIEQRAGRVFKGWEEGRIYFAPTYKYLSNSDHYVAQTPSSKEKWRTPAWCDRILWKGDGLKQLWYLRGESKFSDHRPVYSLFLVEVNDANRKKSLPNIPKAPLRVPASADLSPTDHVAQVEGDELVFITSIEGHRRSTPIYDFHL